MFEKEQMDFIKKVVPAIVLILILIFAMVWVGFLKCGTVPFLCEGYDLVFGAPRVLIATSNTGMGDPQMLKTIMMDPRYVGAPSVDVSNVENLSIGNLRNYKLVIVEKAAVLSFDELSMFKDYVTQGGRLVWIADSGTQRADGEPSYADLNAGISDTNSKYIKDLVENPWLRVKETETSFDLLSFDEFLGLRYVGNYCVLNTKCAATFFNLGALEPEKTGNHPLIYGLTARLPFKISKDHDFSVVKQFANSSNSTVVMTTDFGSKLNYGANQSIGPTVPMIVASGLGERVTYYAYPPEQFMTDNNYSGLLLKNMYYGTLGR